MGIKWAKIRKSEESIDDEDPDLEQVDMEWNTASISLPEYIASSDYAIASLRRNDVDSIIIQKDDQLFKEIDQIAQDETLVGENIEEDDEGEEQMEVDEDE
uniref:Uncharacterized protein n=1 Tax=Ananas comosus var. bracteatus TaxID=296719 RepID=A0A6V7NSX9_ANACO|nr:unnamed protein product [Ananas comosus var. bracteatus]